MHLPHLPVHLNPRTRQRLGKIAMLVLKVGITTSVLTYIGFQLYRDWPSADAWASIINRTSGGWILICLLLMPINWGLEAIKWKFAVRRYYPNLSWGHAWQGVWAGISMGIFTPNRLGEYAGRVLYLQKGKRIEAGFMLFADRLCQLFITIWMGIVGMEYILMYDPDMVDEHFPSHYLSIFRYILWGIGAVCILLVSFPQLVTPLLAKWSAKIPRLRKQADAFLQMNCRSLLVLVGLGAVRYLVFSAQYIGLVIAFGYEGNIGILLALISMIFLIKSILPSFALTELGIRETVAIALMGMFGISATIAFGSTFLLYIINLILPALIGLPFVYRIKAA